MKRHFYKAHTGRLLAALLASLLLATAATAQARRKVAILPIVVHSTEERDFLRLGLSDMLASRVGREQGVAVIRLDDPALATTDPATAQAAAKAAGAEWALFGSFTRFGDGASLDVRCVPVAGQTDDPKSVFVQAGTLGDIIPRLDNLAKRVAHHVTAGASARRAASTAAGGDVGDALSELDALRGRIEALEREVFTKDDSGDTAAR